MLQPADEVDEDGNKNMVSNMPLLFADGYPTSLDKISEEQLEKFIPFMVQCSLAHGENHALADYRKPSWWPKDVEFTKPFKKPKSFTGIWLQKMREIVVFCYSHHACVYLLRYCNDLASYQHTSLRFINNYNSTTSLYERSTNKLLVTFRNENMLYDQEQITSRKCLLPKQSSSQSSQASQEEMVISATFDIYLCDNCDAELYSYGALVEHEKSCLSEQIDDEPSDDDDVIFCGEFIDEINPLGPTARERAELQKKTAFLSQNFALCSKKICEPTALKALPAMDECGAVPTDKSPTKRSRMARRTRGVMTLAKCAQIPLSSPVGQYLLRTTKTITTTAYLAERHDRLERFCHAPALPPGMGQLIRQRRGSAINEHDGPTVLDRRLPKWLLSRPRANGSMPGGSYVPVSFKRSADDTTEPYHVYKFPRRQFSQRCRWENYLFYNKPLLARCQTCAVELKRLNADELKVLSEWPGIERVKREKEQAALERQRWNVIVENATIIDSIDLCSSEDEQVLSDSEGCDGTIDGGFHVASEPQVDESNAEQSRNDPHNDDDEDFETIVIEEEEDEGTVPLPPSSLASHRRSSVHSIIQLQTNSVVPGTLLSGSTIRLNHHVFTGLSNGELLADGRFGHKYTNCSATAITVSNTTSSIANGELKENRVNGWLQKGLAVQPSSTEGFCSIVSPAPRTSIAGSTQTHTASHILLTSPIAPNTVLGTIPMPFTSRPVSLQPNGSATVVHTLTSAAIVNQAVRKRMSVPRASGSTAGTAVTGTTANLQ
ncbi:uncharacterized protein LOC128273897 [Anopheles cruzii]|uniref:uncharacterized protein LOC128273897 n=1 Tax=Anopheles cruzii TaxID=68878 RepID=UPI0022EC868B|nr:uncharacterized protein LOC128273897 [Anopheles cruzii]